MRVKIEEFEVENPKEAMKNFQNALAQIVTVPKAEVERKHKKTKAKYKKRRKVEPPMLKQDRKSI